MNVPGHLLAAAHLLGIDVVAQEQKRRGRPLAKKAPEAEKPLPAEVQTGRDYGLEEIPAREPEGLRPFKRERLEGPNVRKKDLRSLPKEIPTEWGGKGGKPQATPGIGLRAPGRGRDIPEEIPLIQAIDQIPEMEGAIREIELKRLELIEGMKQVEIETRALKTMYDAGRALFTTLQEMDAELAARLMDELEEDSDIIEDANGRIVKIMQTMTRMLTVTPELHERFKRAFKDGNLSVGSQILLQMTGIVDLPRIEGEPIPELTMSQVEDSMNGPAYIQHFVDDIREEQNRKNPRQPWDEHEAWRFALTALARAREKAGLGSAEGALDRLNAARKAVENFREVAAKVNAYVKHWLRRNPERKNKKGSLMRRSQEEIEPSGEGSELFHKGIAPLINDVIEASHEAASIFVEIADEVKAAVGQSPEEERLPLAASINIYDLS